MCGKRLSSLRSQPCSSSFAQRGVLKPTASPRQGHGMRKLVRVGEGISNSGVMTHAGTLRHVCCARETRALGEQGRIGGLCGELRGKSCAFEEQGRGRKEECKVCKQRSRKARRRSPTRARRSSSRSTRPCSPTRSSVRSRSPARTAPSQGRSATRIPTRKPCPRRSWDGAAAAQARGFGGVGQHPLSRSRTRGGVPMHKRRSESCAASPARWARERSRSPRQMLDQFFDYVRRHT